MQCACINQTKGNACQSKALANKKTCSRHIDHCTLKKNTNKSSGKKQTQKKKVEKQTDKKRFISSVKKESKDNNAKTTALQTMKLIYDITFPQFRFSEWIFKQYNKDSVFEKLKQAKVYYHKSKHATLSNVMKLVKEREPVNIAREKGFDTIQMKKTFGWDTAFYDRYFQKNKKLAPNIAVFTPALILQKGIFSEINILNAIGLAFDSKQQSDYKFFLGPNNAFKNIQESKKEILVFYRKLIAKIYQCAIRQNLKTLVICCIGMGFFQEFYPGDMFTEIFMVAFQQEARTELINTLFMGFSSTQQKQMKRIFSQFKDIGYFPECTSQVNLKETLFLSPADPLAYFSNGAKGDHSLEGIIGTHTSIAIAGNGIVNPSLSLASNYIAL